MADTKYNIRGFFGELKNVPDFVNQLIDECEAAGSFTRGIASDKKQRGSSINVDVYGYDEALGLAVIQVRECRFHPRRYNRVRKNYYLIGRTESGNIFAHPIDSPARSARAMDTPEACVRWVECKIFCCTERQLSKIVRQGDVAFVPAAIPADAERVPVGEFLVDEGGSHLLRGERAYLSGRKLFVRGNAALVHVKKQHAPIAVPRGSWRIQVGYRAETWDFSAPTRD